MLSTFKANPIDEDSSYDSDTEINSPHQNVSRNVSETLAQELEEFNSVSLFVSFRHHRHHHLIPDLQQNNEIVVFFLRTLRFVLTDLIYSAEL